MADKKALLEDEALIIRYSGEIPEVAFHESLYYLTRDPDGPGLALAQSDLHILKEAVVDRYRQIILRDLTPENRDQGLYRGPARCAANWQRLCKYCRQEERDIDVLRAELAGALKFFLQHEFSDVETGRRVSCVNCTAEVIDDLAKELGLDDDNLPKGWQELCRS